MCRFREILKMLSHFQLPGVLLSLLITCCGITSGTSDEFRASISLIYALPLLPAQILWMLQIKQKQHCAFMPSNTHDIHETKIITNNGSA